MKDLNEAGFFEGTEKLLEIWFSNNNNNANGVNEFAGGNEGDLRYIPRFELDALLKIVNAEIMSTTHNELIDSYVLSESSMFISQNRFIIKTCGITKLLDAIQPVLELCKKYGYMSTVTNFFYSRRIYLRAEEQIGIHKSFEDEVDYLCSIIPGGSAYILGCKESEQWYLFTMENDSAQSLTTDVTLEILMSDLDEKTMFQFTKMKNKTSEDILINTGISRIVPGSINDGLVFDPIGYSMNGLFKDYYHTIHVTPQPMCSYVSFETNMHLRDYSSLVNKVLSIFNPEKFIITLFSNKGAICGPALEALERIEAAGYQCDDKQGHVLKNYSLAYHHYVKK